MLIVCIAFVIAVSDQVTKQWIRNVFGLGESRPVVDGFFDLTYVRNPGAAWGMFRDHGWALIVLSVAMLILMVVFRRSLVSDIWEHRLAYGLLMGGILGNLMDRIRLNAVTDFLDFYVGDYHWPAFNIADSAICIGVFLYVVSVLWIPGHPIHEERPITTDSTDVYESGH